MDITRFALGGFKNHKDDELLVRATTVLQAMDNNAYFPEPNPALEDVTALMQDFSAKLAAARRKGNPEDTALKNESRARLAKGLTQLAFYVSQAADGRLPVLLSSGFVLSSYPRQGMVPDIVRGLILRDTRQSGQMRLDFSPQKQVLLYEYRIAPATEILGQEEWQDLLNTCSSRLNIIAPLVPLQRYVVQVRAVNAYGKSGWSESAYHTVR